MSRVHPRDVYAVARVAAEAFARPGRDEQPIRWCRIVLTPMMAVYLTAPGTRHWNRRAVLSVSHKVTAVAWALSLAIPFILLVPLLDVWALVVLAAVMLPPVIAFSWVRRVRAQRRTVPGEPDAVSEGAKPPHARWTATLAASVPAEKDAVKRVFRPHIASVLPDGQTLRATATSSRLAEHYVKAGMTRVAGTKKAVFVTAPWRSGDIGD